MDDLIGEFIEETSESLAVLDLELVKLEQNPNDKEILGNIFRLVHTIKGTCGFLGLPRLERVAHAGENVLGKIRDSAIDVTPETISIVLQALDRIKSLMEYLSEHSQEPEGEDQALIDALNHYADGDSRKLAAPAAPSAAPKADMSQAMLDNLPSNEGGLAQEMLDELERAFRDAVPTVDGGSAPTPAVVAAPVAEAEPAAALPVAKPAKETKDLSEVAKEKAIKEGLDADGKEGAVGNQSIRVNLTVLENLMQMVGELVLTRNQLMQIVRNRDDNDLKSPLQNLSHITTELQEAVMKTRMQPIGNAWAKFPRLIRDLSIELNKKIELRMVGAETELDRQLLEMIKDPLTHMVRNSCDHGLEQSKDRAEIGKPETGTVTLSAYHEGGHIIIEISDDGRGVNIARVKQKIIENGLASADDVTGMTEQQIMQYIFKPGFSTAEKVTSVSGRGVGMDVVRTNIEKIGGTVELTSTPGKGSTFHIKIPLTLAIVSVLIVEAGGERFAIPQINVLELVRSAADSDYQVEEINGAPVLRLRDKLLPLISLNQALELPEVERELSEIDIELGYHEADERFIVVCRVGGNEFGVVVDRIYDTEEIVVKPVSQLLKDIAVFSGNTILGDGSVIMILDPNGLARLIGDTDASAKENADAMRKLAGIDRMVSFLLFKSGDGAPKAVPLELVSRLEEIDVKHIELSGDNRVIQYRGDLMRLTRLQDHALPASGMCEVVVFTYDNKTIGLIVDEIIDIIEAPLQVRLTSDDEALIGSMVIAGKTTDVVDVGYLLRDMIDYSNVTELLGDESADDVHVVLVEDSMFFRKLTVPFLSKVGYQVSAFGSAKEALEYLKNPANPCHVIVTDIEMPEMDGFQFAERLRDESRYDHLPIIAFTSTINQSFISRSEEIGMNDFILKTDREMLVQSIARHLQRKLEAA